MIVLDTNVVSEIIKPQPDLQVMAWLARQRRSELCTTVVTEAELAYGLALMEAGKRKAGLIQAVARLLKEGLGNRVVAFDRHAASVYGEITAGRRRRGLEIATADSQIAAIACAIGAAGIATRDRKGFMGGPVPITDPWAG